MSDSQWRRFQQRAAVFCATASSRRAHSDSEFRRVPGFSCVASPKWKIQTKIYDQNEFLSLLHSFSAAKWSQLCGTCSVRLDSSSRAFIHFCSCFIWCFNCIISLIFIFFNLYLLPVQTNSDCLFYFHLYSLHFAQLSVWIWFKNRLKYITGFYCII